MPVYEYCCQKCGHCFDALQGLSDEPLSQCPQCKELSLEKMMSAPMFQLKGTGWYETDFKKKKVTAADNKSESAKSEPETKKKESSSDE